VGVVGAATVPAGPGLGVTDAAADATGAVGLSKAAMVPPKIVAVPTTASATMPNATSELVLTVTGGSIQSGS
jgi:hypothetical protein